MVFSSQGHKRYKTKAGQPFIHTSHNLHMKWNKKKLTDFLDQYGLSKLKLKVSNTYEHKCQYKVSTKINRISHVIVGLLEAP